MFWFMFLKTVFCSQKQEEQEKNVWFPVFFFFLNIKNTKNTKFKEQIRVFGKHIFHVLCVFKNCSQ